MRFEALDAWRGLAALMVALVHLSAVGWFYDIPAIRHGGSAVPLFFVLSGFVITHAYGHRLRTRAEGWSFVVRRFGRLYPLHLFTLALLVGLELIKLAMTQAGVGAGQAAFTGTNSIDNLAAQLVLMHAVIPFGYYGWNIASWSISVEWIACLAFMATMLAGRSRSAVWSGVLCAVFCALLLAHDLSGLRIETMHGRGVLLGLCGFFLGGVVHQIHGQLLARGWKGGTGAEVIGTMIVCGLFWFAPPSEFVTVVGFAAVILIFALQGGLVSRWLVTRVPQFLGRISYSIYLIHFVLLSVLYGIIRAIQSMTGLRLMTGDRIDFGPAGTMDALAVAYLAIVIGVAWATYVWIESPGRAFFNALSNRQTARIALRAAFDDVRHQAAH